MLDADEVFICARCGWLAIDDQCACTSPPSSAGGGRAAGIAMAWVTAVAAALVIVALVTVTSA